MTIRDLLAAESINLNGTPAGKTEALNQCIDSVSYTHLREVLFR